MIAFHDLLFRDRITVNSNPAHDDAAEAAIAAPSAGCGSSFPGDSAGRRARRTACSARSSAIRRSPTSSTAPCSARPIWSASGRRTASSSATSLTCNAAATTTCIRYSRVPELGALAGCAWREQPDNSSPTTRTSSSLYFEDAGVCTLRRAAFGEPGCGVLDLTTVRASSPAPRTAARWAPATTSSTARGSTRVTRKLADFLPLGQEIAIRYDPPLASARGRGIEGGRCHESAVSRATVTGPRCAIRASITSRARW